MRTGDFNCAFKLSDIRAAAPYIVLRMTLSRLASNLTNRLPALGFLLVAAALLATACSPRTPPPPFAEFVIAAGDSAYWVRSDGAGVRMRGAPIVLSRLDGRFYELYVEDDDRSFEDAFFIGQTLYQRDLVTGDSTEVFRDSVVAAMADKYGRRNPGARRLAPDEDTDTDPASSASAELSVLAVHGPYLSLEYHVDTSDATDDTWHMTRHEVVDLRSGRRVNLTELLGRGTATTVLGRARRLYRETVDSVLKDDRAPARRAARAISRFRFDPTSFALAAPSGALMIAFSAPGQGNGGEGFVLPIRPIAVSEPAWWAEAREALPTSITDGEERWRRPRFSVRAIYDTIVRPVRLVLEDSAGREYPIGGVTAPVHRIYWLDDSRFDSTQRRALIKAFDEAALYDESVKTASRGTSATWAFAWNRATDHKSRFTPVQ
jgi:hypothetical protein